MNIAPQSSPLNSVSRTQIACAEAISLLHLISPVPEQPSLNVFPESLSQHQSCYLLSSEEEISLTSSLAFLACVVEDPDRVPALCVLQDSKEQSLTVLVAVNQAGYGGGHNALNKIKAGFEGIAASLRTEDQSKIDERRVFSNIVSMCSHRILSRMRLVRHKLGHTRQKMQDLIRKVAGFTGPAEAVFRDDAQSLIKLIASWEEDQTCDRLCNIVEAVHRFSQKHDLIKILSSVSDRWPDLCQRNNILKMVKRTSRYREVATILVRLAKKHAHIRNMRVCGVQLPKEAFPDNTFEYAPDLASTIRKLGFSASQDKLLNLLNKGKILAQVSFAEQFNKTLRKGKFHAEMQLIRYCEEMEFEMGPRSIQSSKKACFLCNAFMSSSNRYYTTRSHGRLHPGWKLPIFAGPVPNHLSQKFVLDLEDRTRRSLQRLVSQSKRIIYRQPSESTLWTLCLSASAVNIYTGASGATDDMMGVLPQSADTVNLTQRRTDSRAASPEKEEEEEEEEEEEVEEEKRVKFITANTLPRSTCLNTRPKLVSTSVLQPGTAVSIALRAGASSVFLNAGPLSLHIQYIMSTEFLEAEKQLPTVHIMLLDQVHVDSLVNERKLPLIDITSLSTGQDSSIGHTDNFVLRLDNHYWEITIE